MTATDVETHCLRAARKGLCARIAFIWHNVMSGTFTYAFIYWAENVNVNALPWKEKHSYSNTVAQAFSSHEYLCPHQERQILTRKLALVN